MLYEVMRHVNNYFVLKQFNGDYKIVDGKLDAPIDEAEYFLIDGSLYNDGLHTPEDELKDEAFSGTVAVCAIPQAFLDLVKDIESWQEKYRDTAESPYSSESFGGYSYSKASGNGSSSTWAQTFASQLNSWRKL